MSIEFRMAFLSPLPSLRRRLTQPMFWLAGIGLSILAWGHAMASEAAHSSAAPVSVSEEALPAVVIRAQPPKPGQTDTLEPTQTLGKAALQMKSGATLGATLQDELGVANASFGPNVGLPVIRGQGGSRVRAMSGGLGTHDASSTSADHAVMVEPALAESITIWKGPAAIRFGGSAISGAVDIEDGRIPARRPSTLKSRLEARARDGGHLALATLDAPASGGLAWHLDVHRRRQGDTRIPGMAIDEDAVRQQFYLVSARNTQGHIGNTDARTDGGAWGVSWWGEQAKVGMSLSTLRQDHGIPSGGHSHAPTVIRPGQVPEAEAVRIRAQQQRLDIKGEWYDPIGPDGTLRWRVVNTDYHHDELSAGVPRTRFSNHVTEARADLEHKLSDQWRLTVGAHAQSRLFEANGEEAFVPKTRVVSAGVYALNQWSHAPWRVEVGLRTDVQSSRPQAAQTASQGLTLTLPERHFKPGSLSVSASRGHQGGAITLTHWHVSRAPDVQELYALGPHLATLTYDMGNSALATEKLRGWDLGLEQTLWGSTLKANAFVYDSARHIYQRSQGVFYAADEQQFRSLCARLDQCLPVTSYEQAAARLYGGEASWTIPLVRLDDPQAPPPWQIGLDADVVRGQLRSGEDLPRLPPLRWGLRLEHQRGPWSSSWRLSRLEAQRRPGANETATAASLQVHGNLRWSAPAGSRTRWSWFVSGRNLTHQEVRNSTSFLRNLAPEPGRTLEIGVEVRL